MPAMATGAHVVLGDNMGGKRRGSNPRLDGLVRVRRPRSVGGAVSPTSREVRRNDGASGVLRKQVRTGVTPERMPFGGAMRGPHQGFCVFRSCKHVADSCTARADTAADWPLASTSWKSRSRHLGSMARRATRRGVTLPPAKTLLANTGFEDTPLRTFPCSRRVKPFGRAAAETSR